MFLITLPLGPLGYQHVSTNLPVFSSKKDHPSPAWSAASPCNGKSKGPSGSHGTNLAIWLSCHGFRVFVTYEERAGSFERSIDPWTYIVIEIHQRIRFPLPSLECKTILGSEYWVRFKDMGSSEFHLVVVQSHSLCWELLIEISGSVAALLGWWSGGAIDVKQSENLTNFCLSETWTSRRKLWSFCHPAKLLISWICISVFKGCKAHHCEGFLDPKFDLFLFLLMFHHAFVSAYWGATLGSFATLLAADTLHINYCLKNPRCPERYMYIIIYISKIIHHHCVSKS